MFAGVNDTAEKLFTGVNDTVNKFFGVDNDTGEWRVLPILACLHLKMKNKHKVTNYKRRQKILNVAFFSGWVWPAALISPRNQLWTTSWKPPLALLILHRMVGSFKTKYSDSNCQRVFVKIQFYANKYIIGADVH